MTIQIKEHNNSLQIIFEQACTEFELPALWLRERSQEYDQVDGKTKQRLWDPHLCSASLSIQQASFRNNTLQVTFSDQHISAYTTDYLSEQVTCFDTGLPKPFAWRADDDLPVRFDWQELQNNQYLFDHSVSEFLRYGYLTFYNTPTEKDSLLSIAEHYGFVRETNFGRYFEVYSKPLANDLAYTPHAIGPHTDNPYREPVPGIQLLHCLDNQTQGGFSTLVDSLSIAKLIQNEHPKAYKLLTDTIVRFRFFDQDCELVSFHPLIEQDNLGNVLGIHYSPRLDDLPLLSQAKTAEFQNARNILGKLLSDIRFEKKFKLNKGELMMFDNNRILHGRTAFNPQQGIRHLQGCYIDRDGPKSLYRVANRSPNRTLPTC